MNFVANSQLRSSSAFSKDDFRRCMNCVVNARAAGLSVKVKKSDCKDCFYRHFREWVYITRASNLDYNIARSLLDD